ncbi:MAG TPA: tail fiber domain-containing protein, partial [Blastocatellia bacterium]|nr:tail fiber domain-containing protein [Blastocatellia bacterium]
SYGLREVLLLKPVSWAWKEKSDEALNLGLIAQEVEPLIPELVSTGTDAEQTKGLNYIGLIPVLVKGVQEQQTQIEGQQKRIIQQQEQIKQQQTQLDGLKRLVCLDHANADVCRAAERKP